MNMPWFRMYSEFATDPKVQAMPEHMQRRLVMLFCLQCSNNYNPSNIDEIAYALRIDECNVSETFHYFIKRGFLDENGHIINWDKRQYKSDTSSERVKKHRTKAIEKQQNTHDETFQKRYSNGNVTPPDTDTEEELEVDNTDTVEIKLIGQKNTDGIGSAFSQNAKSAPKPKGESKKGKRLPPDWRLPADDLQWAIDNTAMTTQQIGVEAEKFRDYWHAQAGTKGVKLDWAATWRNWIRGSKAYTPRITTESAAVLDVWPENGIKADLEKIASFGYLSMEQGRAWLKTARKTANGGHIKLILPTKFIKQHVEQNFMDALRKYYGDDLELAVG